MNLGRWPNKIPNSLLMAYASQRKLDIHQDLNLHPPASPPSDPAWPKPYIQSGKPARSTRGLLEIPQIHSDAHQADCKSEYLQPRVRSLHLHSYSDASARTVVGCHRWWPGDALHWCSLLLVPIGFGSGSRYCRGAGLCVLRGRWGTCVAGR